MTAGPQDPGGLPWSRIARDAVSALEERNLGADASLDVRRMIEEVTGCEPGEYLNELDRPATTRALARFDAMVSRRSAGEPLQYVLGRWSFRQLDLMVDRRVLIPRPETESVVEVALGEIDALIERGGHDYDHRLTIADLGTGSGAIALSILSERKITEVWATDVSEDALAVARSNLAGLGRAGIRMHLRSGSWFDALPAGLLGTIGLVVSNPPYVGNEETLSSEVEEWEPAVALRSGTGGLDAAEHILRSAPRWLRGDGVVVLELAPGQMQRASELARSAGFASVEVRPDLSGRDRCLIGRLDG